MKEKAYCRDCKRAVEKTTEKERLEIRCAVSGQRRELDEHAPKICIERGKNDGYEEKTRGLFDEV